MKKTIHTLAAAGAALLLAAAGQAQAQTTPFYARADAGGSLMNDIKIKSAGGARNDVDPGGRFDVAMGYQVTDFLAGELEIGVLGNQLDTDAGQPISPNISRAYLYQVPVLANLVLQAPLPGGVTPYIGAGVGGETASLDEHRRGGDWRSDSDTSFAYQAMAGVKVQVHRRIEVGIGYKFLGTLDHTFFDDSPTRFVQTGNFFNHSILATFVFHF